MSDNLPVKRDTFSVAINANQFNALIVGCSRLVKSGFLPASIKTGEQAAAIALAGQELGIMPMTAFRCINIIQGKPCISSELMIAKFFRDIPGAQIEWINNGDDGIASLRIRRSSELKWQEFSFTRKQAQDAGLLAKDNWKKYEPAMLRARVASAALRAVAPDSQMGLYTPDEMGAVTNELEEVQESERIEAEVVQDTPAQSDEPPAPAKQPPAEDENTKGKSPFYLLEKFKSAHELMDDILYYRFLEKAFRETANDTMFTAVMKSIKDDGNLHANMIPVPVRKQVILKMKEIYDAHLAKQTPPPASPPKPVDPLFAMNSSDAVLQIEAMLAEFEAPADKFNAYITGELNAENITDLVTRLPQFIGLAKEWIKQNKKVQE